MFLSLQTVEVIRPWFKRIIKALSIHLFAPFFNLNLISLPISVLQDQALGHWQVKRQVGNASPIIFKFPQKFTLKAGGTVTVSYAEPFLLFDFCL